MTNVIDKIKEFLLGVRAELEKVSWPERTQVQSATILILILVLVCAAIIGALDLIITQVLGLFFKI
jgi:preprotein translocase subunit SecE